MERWTTNRTPRGEIADRLDSLLAGLADADRERLAPPRLRRWLLAEVRLRAAAGCGRSTARFPLTWAALCGLLLMAGTLAGGSYFLRVRATAPAPKPPMTAASAFPDYVALPYSDPAIANGTEATVRVTLPYAQLMAWGVPSMGRDPDEEIEADLVFGDDGLPQAIRIVSPTPTLSQETHP
jgi:hypothetical protein